MFAKIGESLCKKAFSIGEKSEMGGVGVKNDLKKSDIIYGCPHRTIFGHCLANARLMLGQC